MHVIFDVVLLLCRIIGLYFEALFRLFVPTSAKNIRGKVVLVTGAGRGIGRQIAIKFSEYGVKLALLDIDEATARETAQIVSACGVTAFSYKCDVTDIKNISDVAAKIRRDLGEVDILVNNAGVLVGKTLLQLDESEIRRTFEINTLSHFWTLKEFLPSMIRSKSGHVVCVCSMSAKGPTTLLTDYGASKSAIDGLYMQLEEELHYLKADEIRLTTVYPMVVNTRLVSDVNHRCVYHDRLAGMIEPDDVANALVDGVLHNRKHVYVPSRMKAVFLLNSLFPEKAQRFILDFINVGFTEKKIQHQ